MNNKRNLISNNIIGVVALGTNLRTLSVFHHPLSHLISYKDELLYFASLFDINLLSNGTYQNVWRDPKSISQIFGHNLQSSFLTGSQ